MRGQSALLLVLGAAGIGGGLYAPPHPAGQPTAPSKLAFSRDIMPILSDKCFKCHGPDPETRMANLRLDTPESVFANRSGHFAIVRGRPDRSVLVTRIERHEMPPRNSGKSLSDGEIATLKQWIAQGAPYGKLWSFESLPVRISAPTVKEGWPRDDLDRFVLGRLTEHGLAPSPPASRLRWLRRVTYDLTGLPPTGPEIAAFAADSSYERVVDRLLASPHCGEHLAVDWLDAARYSDSYGYQSDLLSPNWPYRDWVVKAFNANMPYNRFLVDQIAGDLLPNPTRDERLATAFNRLHRQSNEGGSIALEYKTEYAADRVATYGSAMLGLTLGCARCHDHKFDPITQKEYYQLFAYFNSIPESGLIISSEIVPTPSLLLPTLGQEQRLAELKRADHEAREVLALRTVGAEARFEAWQSSKRHSVRDDTIPDLLGDFSLEIYDGAKFANRVAGPAFGSKIGGVELVPGRVGKAARFTGDNGIAFHGLPSQERWDAFTWSFGIRDEQASKGPTVLLHRTGGTDTGFCGFDLMLEDGYLTARVMRHWPGNGIGVRTIRPIPKGQWTSIAWSWDGFGRAAGLRLYIDGAPAQVEVLNDRIWKKIRAAGDLGDSGGNWTFANRFRDAGFRGDLDEVRFVGRALSSLEVSLLASPPSQARSGGGGGSGVGVTALRDYYISALDEPCRAASADARKAQENLANFEEGILETPVMEETKTPTPAYLLARGNYDSPRTPENLVHRDVPKCFPSLVLREEGHSGERPLRPDMRSAARQPPADNDRLALAKWTVRDDNPLAARVAVNRIWQMLFGVGLVETSENLGVQGSRPLNRELLDYLARQFIDSGWNVKAMVRRIVLSSTYRQDSALTKRLAAKDPENHLLSRGPSHRLSAEEIRDTALCAAGLVNLKLGGPPVNPYQPAGIWNETNTMTPGFVQSKGADLYRRSIYSTWKRTTPVPSMMLFDATSREACAIRRQVTNTPLQALVLLNDVQFVESARVLADHVLRLSLSDSERVKIAFSRLAGRDPTAVESNILLGALADQRAQFRAAPASAAKLIHLGDSPPDPKSDPVELAAMTATVQIVMNSDCVVWER